MYETPDSILTIKSDAFSKRIVKMVKYIRTNGESTFFPLLNQILRSGTSISANIGESRFAQSKADFIAKLHIALKEANETRKWLMMLKEGEQLTPTQFVSMDNDCNEIISILVASLKTSKKNSTIIVR